MVFKSMLMNLAPGVEITLLIKSIVSIRGAAGEPASSA